METKLEASTSQRWAINEATKWNGQKPIEYFNTPQKESFGSLGK